jgi:transcriptional regulator with XRE-family HTH domain
VTISEAAEALERDVLAAFKASGLTVSQLLTKSGLSLERSTLQRKLSGQTKFTLPELEALARALDIPVPVTTTSVGMAS